MNFTSEDIARYLLAHPRFFEEHPEVLAEMEVPHPQTGLAIPISERQIMALRDKSHVLQDQLGELVRYGKENNAISEKIHHLAVSLLSFDRVDHLLHGLNAGLQEVFSIPYSAVRIWDMTIVEGSGMPEFCEASKEAHLTAEGLLHPYCGPNVPDEVKSWFGNVAHRLCSFAMTALRKEQTVGMLVMGSEDPQRFHPDMGTIYLTQIGELVSAVLGRERRTRT